MTSNLGTHKLVDGHLLSELG